MAATASRVRCSGCGLVYTLSARPMVAVAVSAAEGGTPASYGLRPPVIAPKAAAAQLLVQPMPEGDTPPGPAARVEHATPPDHPPIAEPAPAVQPSAARVAPEPPVARAPVPPPYRPGEPLRRLLPLSVEMAPRAALAPLPIAFGPRLSDETDLPPAYRPIVHAAEANHPAPPRAAQVIRRSLMDEGAVSPLAGHRAVPCVRILVSAAPVDPPVPPFEPPMELQPVADAPPLVAAPVPSVEPPVEPRPVADAPLLVAAPVLPVEPPVELRPVADAPPLVVASTPPVDAPALAWPVGEIARGVRARGPDGMGIAPGNARRSAARRTRPVLSPLTRMPARGRQSPGEDGFPATPRRSFDPPRGNAGTMASPPDITSGARVVAADAALSEAHGTEVHDQDNERLPAFPPAPGMEQDMAMEAHAMAGAARPARGAGARSTVYAIAAATVMMLTIAGYSRWDDVMRYLPGTIRFYSAVDLARGPSASLTRDTAARQIATAAAAPLPACFSGGSAMDCVETKHERITK